MEIWSDAKNVAANIAFNTNWVKIVLALFIIGLAFIARHVFIKLTVKYLNKATLYSKSNINTCIVNAVEVPARLFIIAAGIWLAALVMAFPEKYEFFINRVFRTIAVFLTLTAAYRASDVLAMLIDRISMGSEGKTDEMLLLFVRKSVRIVIIVFGVVTLLQEWYDNVGGLLAGLGLGGLAFALAAKDTVSNLFGSVTILMDRAFRIGDWVETPHGEGIVEEIGFRSTKIRTFSQAVLSIPNSTMSNDSITNWSRMGKRKVSFYLNFRLDASTQKIREFIEFFREDLKNCPGIHPETIVVAFEKFSDSSQQVLFYFFTNTTKWLEYLEVVEAINFRIAEKLEEMQLKLAVPARRVYLERQKPE